MKLFTATIAILFSFTLQAQHLVRGYILDRATEEPLQFASLIIEHTNLSTYTDDSGYFELESSSLPVKILITYMGYDDRTLSIETAIKIYRIKLEPNAELLEGVEVKERALTTQEHRSVLSHEVLTPLSLRNTAAINYYEAQGALKGVDLVAPSLGFKIVNTRGFTSTAPVRSLQLIDGIDNQSPGLNFSLGGFLGPAELDVNRIEVVAGASSSYYGPNAFNGVVQIETKSPFHHPGLSVLLKGGERNLLEGGLRWAQVFKNKKNVPFLAYKINASYLRADDWEAENYSPIDESRVPEDNPGRFDAVNIYGDQYRPIYDFSESAPWIYEGLGTFYRTGYRETDLVDYDTRNIKLNAAVHWRLKPDQLDDSPELIAAANYGGGTTVYQAENRFSLKNIRFLQTRLSLQKENAYTFRLYHTTEDAGDSYDPYATALYLVDEGKSTLQWSASYQQFWTSQITPRIYELGYPRLNYPEPFDTEAAEQWLIDYRDSLTYWHQWAESYANADTTLGGPVFLTPGSPEFEEAFNRIISTPNSADEPGSKFFDRSSLYHFDGEYIFKPVLVDQLKVGIDARLYQPRSEGTIFSDTAGRRITNYEYGFYAGFEKQFPNRQWTVGATLRLDKNQNFPWVASPAVSVRWEPNTSNLLRLSFASAIRNPTLSNQYQYLDVGPATLVGNLNGADSLITLESFSDYLQERTLSSLSYYNLDPIRPEKAQTIELGYRGQPFDRLYVDAELYYSRYRDFIGFDIGIKSSFNALGLPVGAEVFRHAINAQEVVFTQGAAIQLDYRINPFLSLGGNYSWNKLISQSDDPIIPAYNTPEHKYNLLLTGREIPLNKQLTWGFQLNYRWIEGFIFEGSPQFTGLVPSYDLTNLQLNLHFQQLGIRLKAGATNIFNNRQYQVYGGPRIGRLAYLTILYKPSL